MLPELMHDPVPDILICTCIDSVLAIGQNIIFCHTESLQDVVKTHSRVFNCLAFLRSDASSKELAWLATRQHYQDALWELAESSLPPKCWSFPQILAVAAAEAVAAIEARSIGDMKFDLGIRILRWRLQEIRKETDDRWAIPELPPSEDITSCGYRASFCQGAICKDSNGGWKVGQSKELSAPVVIVKASAEQMLWLSQYPDFSRVLRALQDRFGATEIETERFLALQAALDIGIFRVSVEDWFEGVDIFVRELERMLIEGVIAPEP
jgi:hypothetical protein